MGGCMEIAFFTEMGFTGKISRTHENMRTEFAWMCAKRRSLSYKLTSFKTV